MRRIIVVVFAAATFIVAMAAANMHRFWFPGATLQQSVHLWLSEPKFASPATDRVKKGWPESLSMACAQTSNCRDLGFQTQRKLARLIAESDPEPAIGLAAELFSGSTVEQQSLGALLLAKHNRENSSETVIAFARDSVGRVHRGQVRDPFSSTDYLAEMGLLTLAHVGTEPACALVNAEKGVDAPSYYVAAVNQAVSICRDRLGERAPGETGKAADKGAD